MRLKRLIYTLSLSALLLLAACSKRSQFNEEIGIPVNQEQQALVLQKTEKLREQWNSSACETVYNQAAPAFRSQALPDWLNQCEGLREKLGTWQNFHSQRATTCGKGTVCLDGIARFGEDRYEVSMGWMVKNRELRLFYLSLARNGKAIQTIPPSPQHLLDPLLPTPVKHR